jgi:hypothetical protein
MIEFVERNGRTWQHGPGGLAETAAMVERIAGEPPPLNEDKFVAWVAGRIS